MSARTDDDRRARCTTRRTPAFRSMTAPDRRAPLSISCARTSASVAASYGMNGTTATVTGLRGRCHCRPTLTRSRTRRRMSEGRPLREGTVRITVAVDGRSRRHHSQRDRRSPRGVAAARARSKRSAESARRNERGPDGAHRRPSWPPSASGSARTIAPTPESSRGHRNTHCPGRRRESRIDCWRRRRCARSQAELSGHSTDWARQTRGPREGSSRLLRTLGESAARHGGDRGGLQAQLSREL